MKPSNPIELLVCAIATQENNRGSNPGNLRVAGQPHLRPGLVFGQMAEFVADSNGTARQWGVLAPYRDILAKAAAGMTIRQMIYEYCPVDDGANDPVTYCQHIAEWTGLPLDVPFVQLIPPLVMLNVIDASPEPA